MFMTDLLGLAVLETATVKFFKFMCYVLKLFNI